MQAFSDTRCMIFDTYESELRIKRNDAATWANYATVRDHFLRWCQSTGLKPEAIDRRGMLAYFGSLGDLAPATVHRYHRTLHAAYRRAVAPYQIIEADPTEGLPLPPIRRAKPFAYSNDDLRAIKASISRPRDWLAFHLLAYTGMRSVELRRLRWDDVNLRRNDIRITGKQTARGDDERTVPIHPVLRLALLDAGSYHLGERVLPGRQSSRTGDMLSPTGIALLVKRNLPASVARPTGDVCHPFRRAVASSLRRNAVDPDTIDKLLGWAPSSMRASRYMAYEASDFAAAINRLYADDPV